MVLLSLFLAGTAFWCVLIIADQLVSSTEIAGKSGRSQIPSPVRTQQPKSWSFPSAPLNIGRWFDPSWFTTCLMGVGAATTLISTAKALWEVGAPVWKIASVVALPLAGASIVKIFIPQIPFFFTATVFSRLSYARTSSLFSWGKSPITKAPAPPQESPNATQELETRLRALKRERGPRSDV